MVLHTKAALMRSYGVILQVLCFAVLSSLLSAGENAFGPFQHIVPSARLWEIVQEPPRDGNRRVLFSGNVALSAEQLAKALLKDSIQIHVIGFTDKYPEFRSEIGRIRDAYHALGYFDVHVVPRLLLSNNRKAPIVEFQIQEHERYKVRNFEFTGKAPIPESILRGGMNLKESEPFDEAQLDSGIARMLSMCRTRGHILLVIDPTPRFLEEPSQCDLVLAFRDWQGASKPIVGEVSFVGNNILSNDELLRGLKLRKDAPLDADALVADRDWILAYYRDRGLSDVKVVPIATRVTPMPESEDESCTVDFKYEIDEGTPTPGISQRCSPRQ